MPFGPFVFVLLVLFISTTRGSGYQLNTTRYSLGLHCLFVLVDSKHLPSKLRLSLTWRKRTGNEKESTVSSCVHLLIVRLSRWFSATVFVYLILHYRYASAGPVLPELAINHSWGTSPVNLKTLSFLDDALAKTSTRYHFLDKELEKYLMSNRASIRLNISIFILNLTRSCFIHYSLLHTTTPSSMLIEAWES